MNFGLALATFALIIPAELPDKTFISAIILSSRHRPLPVWLGVCSALIVQAGIGVLLGRVIALLPHRTVEGVVAFLFLGGAAYLLFVPENRVMAQGERIAEHEEQLASVNNENDTIPQVSPSSGPSSALRIALTSFGVVALAEFGDLTQVLIANLSARSRDALSVFVGASVGFIVISTVGVLAGRAIVRVVPMSIVRKISGLALAGLGIWNVVTLITS